MILKFLTRARVGYVLVAIVLLDAVLVITGANTICTINGVRNILCGDVVSSLIVTLTLSTILFVPYLVSLFQSPVFFERWIRFAIWGIPLVMISTILTLNIGQHGFIDGRPLVYISIPYFIYLIWASFLYIRRS